MDSTRSDYSGDLSHLYPSSRAVACLAGDDRVAHVRADRWIGYTRATAALKKLEDLSSWPEKQRIGNPRYQILLNDPSVRASSAA
jgi:hypothetical protein